MRGRRVTIETKPAALMKRFYLSDVVEIPVWNALQLLQLCHFIQHLVKVEFGGQEVQSPVAVGLPAKTLGH